MEDIVTVVQLILVSVVLLFVLLGAWALFDHAMRKEREAARRQRRMQEFLDCPDVFEWMAAQEAARERERNR